MTFDARFAAGRCIRGYPVAALVMVLTLVGCKAPWSGTGTRADLTLSGTVEARETQLAFQVGGRIARLETDEGETLAAGAVAARLDTRDYELALEQAKAQAAAAQAALAELEAGTRAQDIKVAQATLVRAQAERDYAQSQVGRARSLAMRNLAAQEQLDQAQMQLKVAQAAVQEARQRLDLLREGPRSEEIERARAEYAGRRAAMQQAERNLTLTTLQSPVTGVVSVRLAEQGEVVAPGQAVLTVEELTEPWVRAYLPETDLARVRLGQPAEVRVDGLPDRVFKGRLTFISPEAEFTPKTVETRELRVDLVYRIKVQVDNSQGLLKVGMPADVALVPAP